MKTAAWRHLQELFHGALEREPGERAAYLEGACGGDAALRERVEALLAAGERADDRIAGAIEGVFELAARSEDGGRPRIGPYRVIEELGRGGLSTVYLAERDDEQYRMEVAVKVIRRGMDTEDILDRLRQERQILASLDHPNIARLYDGGTTEDGLPYVVMEYVRGELIDDHCDRRKLSTVGRLGLFLKVCAAVQYAHRKLVIHRDIKPGNLLVTADGVPKLLDFGIAKILDSGLVPYSLAPTAPGVRLLTPEYASPEQVRGEPLTTAADVYSLGVLLYYLLTGHHPYRLASRRPQEIERVICDTEPEKPSAMVSRVEVVPGNAGTEQVTLTPERISETRDGPPEKLRRRLRGDLDNIVLMALNKEPGRRYASVEHFADDIRRFLDARPVLARSPTLRYRCAKFVRRHRIAVGAAALVLAALLTGLVATLWQARIAIRERARAERNLERATLEQARAERTREFLVDLFEYADPYRTRGEPVTVREVLDRGARRISRSLDDPRDKADLLYTAGEVYANLGLYDEAAPYFEEALGLLGPEHPRAPRVLIALAELCIHQEDTDAAEAHARRALEILSRRQDGAGAGDEEKAAALYQLGLALDGREAYEEAERRLREALELQRRSHRDGHPEVASTLNALGELHLRTHEPEAAEALFREALEMRRRLLDDEDPEVASSLNNLAVLLDVQGRFSEAEELFVSLLELRRKVFGDEHPEVSLTLNNLAAVLAAQDRDREAVPHYREALAINRQILGDDHPDVARNLGNLANALTHLGELAEAEHLARESLRIYERRGLAGGEAFALYRLAEVLAEKGRRGEAEIRYRESLERLEEIAVNEGPDLRVSYPLVGLGILLVEQGQLEEAEALLRQAVEIRRAELEPGDPRIAEAEGALEACRRPAANGTNDR